MRKVSLKPDYLFPSGNMSIESRIVQLNWLVAVSRTVRWRPPPPRRRFDSRPRRPELMFSQLGSLRSSRNYVVRKISPEKGFHRRFLIRQRRSCRRSVKGFYLLFRCRICQFRRYHGSLEFQFHRLPAKNHRNPMIWPIKRSLGFHSLLILSNRRRCHRCHSCHRHHHCFHRSHSSHHHHR